jgi:hypothetical protein
MAYLIKKKRVVIMAWRHAITSAKVGAEAGDELARAHPGHALAPPMAKRREDDGGRKLSA